MEGEWEWREGRMECGEKLTKNGEGRLMEWMEDKY